MSAREATLRWVHLKGDPRGYWYIDGPPHMMMRVRRLFPRAKRQGGGALIADTPDVARDIEWLMGRYPLTMGEHATTRLRRQVAVHRAREAEVAAILAGDGSWSPTLPMDGRPARDYQLVPARMLRASPGLLLVDDLGLGKTQSALMALGNPDALPAVCVVPTHLPSQWLREIAAVWPGMAAWAPRTGKPDEMAKHVKRHGRPDVTVLGWSKVRTWADHLAEDTRTLILDEVQELRTPKTDKYAATAHLAQHARQTIGVTATPVYNYAGDIHSLVSVIAPDSLGTREEFVREWGGSGAGVGDHVALADPDALRSFMESEGLMLRRTRAEVGLDLPGGLPEIVPVITETDEKPLRDMEIALRDLANRIVLGGARPGLQAMQDASEFDLALRKATGVAKAPFVADFVRMLLDSEEKVVVWAWHRDVYGVLLDRLRAMNPVLYTGSESAAGKDRAKKRFVEGDARVLLMSLRSGAGLDGLQQVARVGVFAELDWAPATHAQCVGRLARDGQPHQVTAYYCVSEEGSDPKVQEVLGLKEQQALPFTVGEGRDTAFGQTVVADAGSRVRALAADYLARSKKAPR